MKTDDPLRELYLSFPRRTEQLDPLILPGPLPTVVFAASLYPCIPPITEVIVCCMQSQFICVLMSLTWRTLSEPYISPNRGGAAMKGNE